MDYISIDLLKPHPKNPRKDIGDITELSESIKENGIMQNLTVVNDNDGTYTVIIGHRRLAAAREAGLREVPCAIVAMDEATQLSTMLLENMQRVDLTPYEQAEGFQMCLDIGMSEDDLKQKTGFSKKTIKHRLNLLKLDQKKFKEGVERGATIQDYIDLEQIKDEKAKNELLNYIGTTEFSYKLQSAITSQENKRQTDLFIKKLSMVMKEVDKKPDGYTFTRSLYGVQSFNNYQIPSDVKERNYVFKKNNNYIEIFHEVLESDNIEKKVEETKLPTQVELNIEEIKKKVTTAYKTRLKFAKDIYDNVLDTAETEIVVRYAFAMLHDSLHTFGWQKENIFKKITDIRLKDIQHQDEAMFNSDKNVINVLFALVYASLETTDNNITVIDYVWDTQNFGGFKRGYNSSVQNLYNFLKEFGYQSSEEETAIMFGTHELYAKKDKEE